MFTDKYLRNILVQNCDNCSLIPPFDPQIFSYYVLTPDDVKNVYFETLPADGVQIIIDDASHSLNEDDKLQQKVNEIVSYKVGAFDNVNAMKQDEIKQVMLSFYNPNQINNDSIHQYLNTSLYEWIAEFVEDDTTHSLIETQYAKLEPQLEQNQNGSGKTLDYDGLLHEPWTPVTVDLHYDLHHYRVFVIRKAGLLDLREFTKTMEENKAAFERFSLARCPNVSAQAIVQSEINEQWDSIRCWVVGFAVAAVMGIYIAWDRHSFNQLVAKHNKAMSKRKGG